jgi:hypothetical protein
MGVTEQQLDDHRMLFPNLLRYYPLLQLSKIFFSAISSTRNMEESQNIPFSYIEFAYTDKSANQISLTGNGVMSYLCCYNIYVAALSYD